MASNPYTISVSRSGKPIKSLHATIEDMVIEEIKDAQDYIDRLQSGKRSTNWDRYYGRPLGNERKGRSKFMSRDVMETVEWIMPSLLSTFVSSDPKVEIIIEGQPASTGKALMQKIQDDLNDNEERSMYVLFYQWFKDALVSDTAFLSPSWNVDMQSISHRFPQLDRQQIIAISSAPDVQIEEYTDNGDGTYSDVDIMMEEMLGEKVEVDNIPHWDVLVSKDAKYINDEYGKGYNSKVTFDYLLRTNDEYQESDGEDFFVGLDKLRYYLSHDRTIDSSEYSSYMDGAEDSSSINSVSVVGSEEELSQKQTLTVTQWYTRYDVNRDGMLENIKCWVAEDEVLLRWELNDDDAIMLCALSPIIDCYKLFGIAYSELISDIQNLKTMVIRRILDNFDFSTLGRTFYRPGAKIPIRELLQNVPGDALPIDPNDMKTEYPQPFDSRVLQLIEYADSTKENRTGSTRYNQGTDAESLNKTATGMDMIQQAGQKRIDMVARLFAETGIRDFYKKCAMLYQKNLTEPFTIRILGEDIQVTPQMLQGKIKCKVNLGVEAQIGMMEAKKVQGIVAFLSGLNQIFPGILGPKQIHNLSTKFVAQMGNKQPEEYVATMEEFIKSLEVTQKQAQAAQQFEQSIEMEKIKVEYAKVQIAAKKVGVDLQDVLIGNQTRIRTKQMDDSRQRLSDRLRFISDMARAGITAQTALEVARNRGRSA
jgi:hypothetical protein